MRVSACVALLLVGCSGDDGGKKQDAAVEGPSRMSIYPPVLGLGTEVVVSITSDRSLLDATDITVDLGSGLTLGAITVHDGWSASVPVSVSEGAILGPRDATVDTRGSHWDLSDAIAVVRESIVLEPAHAKLGQMITVEVTGRDTRFIDGNTWASMGDGIQTLSVDVHSPTEATVVAAIAPDAVPGLREVSMETGPDRVIGYDGFNVDRVAVTAVFKPSDVYQGDSVEFTIRGRDTTFLTGEWVADDDGGVERVDGSEIAFWDGGGSNADISVTSYTIVDAETIVGTARVSNAAALGVRDVFVTGAEDVLIPDAVTVHDSPANLNAAAPGLTFNVYRTIDNESGQVRERVEAFGYFVIPLDPPCYQPGAGGGGPAPFDEAGVFATPEPPEPVDCPNPETVSAGEVIWLESDQNVVTMYRRVIESTGQIIYLSRDLTLADYRFDTWYDLHTQGDPVGVPEVLIERVLPTVPADFQIDSPALHGDSRIDRGQDFVYTWPPAQSYPVAFLQTTLDATLADDGGAGFLSAYPWDDGEHTFDAALMSQLSPGYTEFTATVSIEGPRFGLPDSFIQTAQARSLVRTTGTLLLE